MQKFETVSQDVVRVIGDIAAIGAEDIRMLKKMAADSSRRRVRICAHPENGDPLHEMIIVLMADSYIPPHRHLDKSESFHIIEGEQDVIIFTDDGEISQVIPMGSPETGKAFYYRLSSAKYHTVLARTGTVIFHETTNGPFDADDTDYAPWAPAEGDPMDVRQRYIEKLEKIISG